MTTLITLTAISLAAFIFLREKKEVEEKIYYTRRTDRRHRRREFEYAI